MPRNAEVIRQWTILREIERSRGTGLTIDELSDRCGVTTRTIRRDLAALQESGFPIFDDKSRDDGKTRWQINGQAFRATVAGFTLTELSALYFSRTLLESLAGTPFRDDLESAFDKLGAGLTPHMQKFLDQLPRAVVTKTDPSRRRADGDETAHSQIVARALEATLHLRQAMLVYFSQSSERTKTYLVHPYRLAYAQGGLYLMAFVPEYGEVRTFAVERIEGLSLLEEHFTAPDEVPEAAFPHSLGVHSGPPEHVELAFQPAVADYVRAREWHPSQTTHDLPDGGLGLSLNVCRDRALTSWILSFGPTARVVSPTSLAEEIAGQIREAGTQYEK